MAMTAMLITLTYSLRGPFLHEIWLRRKIGLLILTLWTKPRVSQISIYNDKATTKRSQSKG